MPTNLVDQSENLRQVYRQTLVVKQSENLRQSHTRVQVHYLSVCIHVCTHTHAYIHRYILACNTQHTIPYPYTPRFAQKLTEDF